jgi:hypothetical protein
VPKKADASKVRKWRILVDFRKLDVTTGDSFPIPVISEVLDALGNCANVFHQILVRAEDRPKNAFSTSQGHYEYKRMPFGLKGTPATLLD